MEIIITNKILYKRKKILPNLIKIQTKPKTASIKYFRKVKFSNIINFIIGKKNKAFRNRNKKVKPPNPKISKTQFKLPTLKNLIIAIKKTIFMIQSLTTNLNTKTILPKI